MERVVEEHKNEIAAVICEPVFQGGNGMWLYNAGYLKRSANFATVMASCLFWMKLRLDFTARARDLR